MASSAIEAQIEAFPDLVHLLDEGVYVTDRDRVICYWNDAAEQITGYSADQVVGTACHENILEHVNSKGCQLCHGSCPMVAAMDTGNPQQADVFLHHKDGHRVPVHVRGMPLRNAEGEVIGAVEVFSDCSDQQAMKDRLQRLESLAYVDELTGVANRRFTDESLKQKLAEAKRMGWHVGFTVIDIDYFKQFNDGHSHKVGDQVLKLVANTLSNNVRPYDVVGRWGGDEFVIIFVNIEHSELTSVMKRIVALVRTSHLRTDDGPLQVTISAGAVLSDVGDRTQDLFEQADQQLYLAKQAGRNQVAVAPAPQSISAA